MDEKKIIKEFTHNTDVEELKIITDILHHSGTNPVERKKLEDEQEAWRTFDALTGDLRKKLQQQLKITEDMRREKEVAEKKKEEAERRNAEMQKEIEVLKRELGK